MSHVVARGTLYHLIARVIFVFSAYGIHIFTARYLGPDGYGIIGVILSLIIIFRMLLMGGLSQAVTKYTAGYSSQAFSIRNKALQIQAIFSGTLFVLLLLLAPLIAELLHDPDLTYYIRLSSPVIPLMAIYSIYLASLNGMRYFGKQAFTIAFYSVVRFSGVVLLLLIGFGIKGAIIGFIIAPGLSLLLAKNLNRLEPSQGKFPVSKIIKFAIPVIVSSIGLGLLMNIDLLFVKSILMDNIKTGYYTSAVTISRIPYFIFYPFILTLLPSVSKAHEAGDFNLVKKYIKQVFRYMLMAIIPGAALICATSKNLVALIYSATYIKAAVPLSVLIWGISSLTIFLVLTTIVTAVGRPRIAIIVTLFLVPVNIILNMILIPKYELMGAAISTTVTTIAGVAIVATYVYREFKVLVNPVLFIKIVLASGVIFLIAKNTSTHGMFLIAEYAGLLLLYGGLMFALREIKGEDMEMVKGIFSKEKELEERIEPL